jgi:hypothetical protein
MNTKKILVWVSIFIVAGLVIALQPSRLVSASTSSSVAALPAAPQIAEYRSGIFVMASSGLACAGVAWYGPVSACMETYTGEFVVTALNGEEVTRVMTNYQGQARVDLPPGWYIVGVRTETYYPHAAPVIISVPADGYASVFFRIDLGPQ